MKKMCFILLLSLIAASLFAQNGIIRELNGTVELKTSGSSFFVAAKAGDAVMQDTVISTGFKSSALVAVGNSLITVRPLTRLAFSEIRRASGSEALNVNLQAGRVRVDVNPPSGARASLTVSSPIATASVRGTSFEFDTRNIWVRKGLVSFSGRKGHIRMIPGGLSSKLGDDGKAADPVRIKTGDLLPATPVGTESYNGGSGGGTSSANAVIVIELL